LPTCRLKPSRASCPRTFSVPSRVADEQNKRRRHETSGSVHRRQYLITCVVRWCGVRVETYLRQCTSR
jgi:hypothetical protein